VCVAGDPVEVPPSPQFQVHVTVPGTPPKVVLVNVMGVPGQTVESVSTKLTVGDGCTVIVTVEVLVDPPLVATNVTR
jgi:hypothetical protein